VLVKNKVAPPLFREKGIHVIEMKIMEQNLADILVNMYQKNFFVLAGD